MISCNESNNKDEQRLSLQGKEKGHLVEEHEKFLMDKNLIVH